MLLSRIITISMVILVTMLLPGDALSQSSHAADADAAFRLHRYHEAIPLYQKAFRRIPNRPERRRILFQIAECYRKMSDFRRAERAYVRAIRAEYPLPIIYLRYAETLKALGKYDEAKEAYNTYLEDEPGDQRARIARDYCDSAKKWIENPTRWQLENMRRMNSRQDDYSPSYADRRNYNVLVFTSNRDEATGRRRDQWTGEKFSDLFYVTQDRRGNWSRPQLFDEDRIINTAANEGVSTFNERGNVVYFTRCEVSRRDILGCDIYFARKMGRQWGEPEPLNIAADSIRVMHPTLSEDERVIYFASDMPGGYGGADIWMARRTRRTQPFGTPENLGPVINTPGNEMFPYLREDGVLYFSSDGHPGMGGLDIFKSVMVDGSWTTPVNMKYPINSEADDFGIILQGGERGSCEEENGFITSNRNVRGSRGGDDIYSIHLPPILFTLSGTVRNSQTLQRLRGAKVQLKGSDQTEIETVTDRMGVFRFTNQQILCHVTYVLEFSKEGYFNEQGMESTVGLTVSTDLVHNKNLEPIPREPIVLPEIRYKLDEYDLLEQYQDSLTELVQTMRERPEIVVELISHTDHRGPVDYNDSLSFRRSRSCVEYIISQGIEPDRIIAVGRGEREPRKLTRDFYVPEYNVTIPAGSHLTEEFIRNLRTHNQREAAHQLNRRTEFRIVRSDYVSERDTNIPIDSAMLDQYHIMINPEENVVNFWINEQGEITGTAVANGLSMEFVYNEQHKGVAMSLEQAMNMLRYAWITVAHFEERGEAIMEDGTIKDGEKFNLLNLSFGRHMELDNVTITVSHDLDQSLMIGREALERIAPMQIDRDQSRIIFEMNR